MFTAFDGTTSPPYTTTGTTLAGGSTSPIKGTVPANVKCEGIINLSSEQKQNKKDIND